MTINKRRRLVCCAVAVASTFIAGCGASVAGSAQPSPNAAAALVSQSASAAQSATSASTSPSSSLPPSSSTSAHSSLAGKVVVLDPGHDGGNETHATEINKLVPQGFGQYKACDTTGTNADDGYTEHQFNFQVAILVQGILQQDGIKVILTRTTDTGVGPCVNVRAAIGNDAHANAAVSIHADGHYGGHGFQILQAERSVGGASVDAASNRLSMALHGTFLAESGLTPSTYVGTDGYQSRDDLAGLNLTTVPKVLVECGNMKDAGDAALEESASGRQRMAQAIADGIIAFLKEGN